MPVLVLDSYGFGSLQLWICELVMVLSGSSQLWVRQLVALDEDGFGSVLSWFGLFLLLVDEWESGPVHASQLWVFRHFLVPFAVDPSSFFLPLTILTKSRVAKKSTKFIEICAGEM
jgi:hypothetical protein